MRPPTEQVSEATRTTTPVFDRVVCGVELCRVGRLAARQADHDSTAGRIGKRGKGLVE